MNINFNSEEEKNNNKTKDIGLWYIILIYVFIVLGLFIWALLRFFMDKKIPSLLYLIIILLVGIFMFGFLISFEKLYQNVILTYIVITFFIMIWSLCFNKSPLGPLKILRLINFFWFKPLKLLIIFFSLFICYESLKRIFFMLFEKTNHKIPDYYYNGLFMSGIIVLIYSVYKELLLFIIIFMILSATLSYFLLGVKNNFGLPYRLKSQFNMNCKQENWMFIFCILLALISWAIILFFIIIVVIFFILLTHFILWIYRINLIDFSDHKNLSKMFSPIQFM
jgi:hypothetical protein